MNGGVGGDDGGGCGGVGDVSDGDSDDSGGWWWWWFGDSRERLVVGGIVKLGVAADEFWVEETTAYISPMGCSETCNVFTSQWFSYQQFIFLVF